MRRMLLDTPSLTYRAFHALPDSITDPDGQPVNAVRGVLDMHARLVGDYAPDEIVHAFDHDWRPAERVAAYPGYKAQRAEEPAQLTVQFALLRDVLDALGIPRAEAIGWEADDAIAALCARAGPGDETLIVTGDRDLLQLVTDADPCVRLLFTRRGVSDLETFDADGVRGRYGVEPQQYVDYATLRGDSSDGLPGVKGVGEKTARELLRRYGSLAALVADVDNLRPALARNLRAAGDYLLAMREVVPVRGDVDVTLTRAPADAEALARLAARNIDGPIDRVCRAMGSPTP